MRVFWTAFAERQLDDIYAYIQHYSSRSAADIYNKIVDESALLARFPRMWAIEPLLASYPEEYRSFIVRKHYKVVYYIENDSVIYVVAVFDCRQNPAKLSRFVGDNDN